MVVLLVVVIISMINFIVNIFFRMMMRITNCRSFVDNLVHRRISHPPQEMGHQPNIARVHQHLHLRYGVLILRLLDATFGHIMTSLFTMVTQREILRAVGVITNPVAHT